MSSTRLAILAVFIVFILLPPWKPADANGASSDASVVVGLNVPLSGPYKAQGQDEKRAYKLAIRELNSRGGVLGREVGYVIKDTATDPDTAEKNAKQLIREHDAAMVTGGSSSAVALAQSDVCQELGVPFMAALTHSSVTTGFQESKTGYGVQKAHRHTFRWFFNGWMTQDALLPFLKKTYEPGTSFFYVTADYVWGTSLQEALRLGTGFAGGEMAGSVLVPLGSEDYGDALEKARAADPDVLVLVLFGRDMVHALRQATSMGLKQDMDVVVPVIELNMAREAGPEAMEGVFTTTQWYHGLKERFEGSKRFVEKFQAEYGRPPGLAAASAWVAVHQWAAAVERAGSLEAPAVIRELEGHRFQLLKGEEQWRAWDHQAVSSVFVARGKSENEMNGEWDLLKILEKRAGPDLVRSRSENPVMLEPL
jgi:ABC-type branched-subunit amino acid transport system substrate-binding protein